MYSLLHYNTFGIDAQCDDFVEYATLDELRTILPLLKERKWFQIGGGSNLLFVNDFAGVILHSQIKGYTELNRTDSHVWIKVGAGECWDDFVAYCVSHGYYGLENLSLIPGEVGASAVQNIGAYGKEVGDYIDEVETVEVATGRLRVFRPSECEYAYRSSIFKHQLRGQYIVTHVTYRLELQFHPDLKYGAIQNEMHQHNLTQESLTAQELRELVIDMRRRKLPDPKELGSAGSFFMNPVVNETTFQNLFKKYPEMPHYVAKDGVKIPAGWLIEQCGWKGRKMGPVGVYSKQALVLVNLGGAIGADVVKLSNAICHDVQQKFGILIHPEVNFIY